MSDKRAAPDRLRAGWVSSLDLHIELERGTRSVAQSLTRALRDAVRGGRLAPGTRLPSTRALAVDLGIARNTVADAYTELCAEGWLTARQGSGTRVATRAEPRRDGRRPVRAVPTVGHPLTPPVTYNMLPGQPTLSAFPRTAWATAMRRALIAAPAEAFGYQGPAGRVELRRELAGYLARARGVDVSPERVVLSSGFIHGLALTARVLRARGVRRIAVELYGIQEHRAVLERAGLRPVPVPVDDDGMCVEGLAGLGVQAVLLTPAHQFALGGALSPARRAALVDWARRTGGVVLEDDYDGEFRYDRQPIGALQGLDPERVVYLGTASKSLAPAVRLGWMVLPPRLAGEVLEAKGADWTSSSLDQLALAELISSGAYDRHVRAMRLRYRRRRDRLTTALATRAPHVRVTGIAAGLHALLEVPPGTEPQILSQATSEGLALTDLSHLALVPPETPRPALVAGYAPPPDHLYPGAIAALCRALRV
ncbi:HTH-type transcriptional regulatory protein GabR [Streptomyces sp. RB5]|uniref:HTH-type transcriptional regulatory protein GabR n=1 Tax=Streptomyces smaragdinus TaxID=2585196 RepID=A0A7K0CSK1_9ACTN|nr:PLP-dependent aminotransferase family protein [Streptomyces smaragdinus]MQY16410.1 HTH-type transcriptional regulatory protein GabR [Streptomyces smaragdinus]